MDSGTAAIIGAAIGAASAMGSAWGTAWWNARTAKRQLDSQESQAQRQQRFEHTRERRATRQAAYTELISKVQELLDQVMYRDSTWRATCMEIDRITVRVDLEGPAQILPMIERVREAARACLAEGSVMTSLTDDPTEAERRADMRLLAASGVTRTALADFTNAAREVLDDPGTH
ncbi:MULTISPECIES: hypothetical protein [Streptomyces]|uniref:hypothetical protein n=1 Tax=Streptomyces TaxID=1883 RepID=UPI0021A576B6|nr:hypothetical protein [Streptomyces atratus]MCT2542355.1 hypothetical protein [Streptomyces atratus]